MEHSFSRPINETDFELFCLRFLQCYWPDSDPQWFGRKGQRQFGIDIIDMTTRSVPLRAAQVKFIGKPGEILSPAVIENEVIDAKKIPIEEDRLSEYVILTTSEADTHCQLKVLAINMQHKKAGLFTVILLTWNLIEEILRKHPDLWDLSINRSLKSILGPLENQIAQMPRQLIMLMGATKLDNEFETQCEETLARAKQLVDGFHFNDALELLRRLETDSWSSLSSDDKYLLLALRGRASFVKGEWDFAGQCFMRAREFNRGKERAEINYAAGLELTRRSVEAIAQARHVIATFPGAIRPWAVLARCDSAASPEALWEEIPLFARENDEVLVGVAMNALNHNSLGFAQSLLEPLAGKDSDWPAPFLLLAQIRIKQTIAKAPKHLDGALHGYADADVKQIFDLLDKAIAIASRTNDRFFTTEGLILRAEFRSAFNDFAAAHADFARVPVEQQSSAEFLTKYGKFLAISGKDELAIATLTRAYETSPNSRAGMMLALKLRSQKDGHPTRYIELLRFCLDDPDCTQRHLALLLLLERRIELDDLAGCTQLIESTKFDLLGNSTRDTASRWLEHTSARPLTPEDATKLASSAVEEGDISTLFFVGEVLQRCGCRRESLPIWQKLSQISPSVRDAHRLIESARLNDRVDLILDTCRIWRDRGIFDPYLIEAEIGYLEEHAPLEGLRILESYLPHSATRWQTLLWRSWIGFKLDRPELLSLSSEDLPNPTDAGPVDGRVVVQLLAQSGQPQAAWSYAYRLYKTSLATQECVERLQHCSCSVLGHSTSCPDMR
jgi:tetratricopeptide (TPR) repeat protein